MTKELTLAQLQKRKADQDKASGIKTPRPHPRTEAEGLRTGQCTVGDEYLVLGYHTGNFTGRFVRAAGINFAEFEVIQHADPERVGTRVEIPHFLAHICRPAQPKQ